MRRTKAFTLIELMVVVSIIALLAMMLVPALQRAVGMANRASCAGNLNSCYKGIVLYQQSNENQYPMLPGTGWDTVKDGTARLPVGGGGDTTAPYSSTGTANWATERSVTSLMFMLVRDGQGAKLFTCPGDGQAAYDTATQTQVTSGTTSTMQWNWDFSNGADAGADTNLGGKRSVSYSFQCPTAISGATAGTAGAYAGLSNPDQNLIIMADRTPVPAAATGAGPVSATFAGTNKSSNPTWANTLTGTALKPFNSQNHFEGEVMNVLAAGGNVSAPKTPLCGLIISSGTDNGKADLIFTAGGTTTSDDGSTTGTVAESSHYGKNDTYLWGGASK